MLTIGPEIESHGPTVLSDGATNLTQNIPNTDAYTLDDLKRQRVRTPNQNEDIYLLAHGEDPGLPTTKKLALGGKEASTVANLLKDILRPYGVKGADKFKGRIILEGCHGAVRRYQDARITGDSFLDELLNAMRRDKFFQRALDDTVTVAGYLGSSFSTRNPGDVFGVVSVESPAERRELSRSLGRKITEADSLSGEDGVVERRWKQH